MKFAPAQMSVDPGTVGANRGEAVAHVERASARGADLVVLPELFTVGYFAFDSYAREAEPLDGKTLTALGSAAADHGVAVLAGSIVEDLSASAAAGFETPADEGYANTSVFLDRDRNSPPGFNADRAQPRSAGADAFHVTTGRWPFRHDPARSAVPSGGSTTPSRPPPPLLADLAC